MNFIVRAMMKALFSRSVATLSSLFIFTQVALALPPIVVPLKPEASVTFYDRTLTPNPLNKPTDFLPIHLDKMTFQKLIAQKGQELQIDSLVLSENTLATFDGLTRGTDALSLGDIQSSIDTQNRKEFLRLILEMARLRRHAENKEEWDKITQTVRGTRAHWNAYLFKTDYVVVSAMKNDRETKFYVPLNEVLDGAGEIDINSAKLRIAQSLSLKALESLQDTEDFEGADHVKKELAELSKSLENICGLKNHEFKGQAPLGCFITDLGFLHCAGKDKELEDSDKALLRLRKQIALLQIVKKYFPELPGLDKLSTITELENFQVNCDNRDSLFQGFQEELSENES